MSDIGKDLLILEDEKHPPGDTLSMADFKNHTRDLDLNRYIGNDLII